MTLLATNVLIYGFDRSSPFHPWAWDIIRSSATGDGAVVNPVILAEYMIGEREPNTVEARLTGFGVSILDLPFGVSLRGTIAYGRYLENRRQNLVPPASKLPLPDFFIGAHASVLKLLLATADHDRYRTYFPEMEMITPHS